MDFFQQLEDRTLVHQTTRPGMGEWLAEKPRTVYAGFDPTADSLHVGHMMVGMVGEVNRMQADAVSDNVNLTSRLEGLTKYYGVSFLISEDVFLRLGRPDHYSLRLLDRIVVKGRQEPITIYEVLDAEDEIARSLKLSTLAQYQAGRRFYQQGDWAAACSCFEAVLEVNPGDQTSQLYLGRIHQLAKSSARNDWDGIWHFTRK